MQVRITTDTPYTPKAGDSPRLYGQLKLRPTKGQYPHVISGPMVTFFPVGAKPELPDELARELIAGGVAEAIDGPAVVFVSTAEIVQDVKAE